MVSVKRAFTYLKRKKVHTVILVVIFLLLMILSSTAMAIKTSVDIQTEKVRKEYGAGFRLEIFVPEDDPSLWETQEIDGSTARKYIGPYVTPEIISEICSIDNVDKYNTKMINWVYSNDLLLVPGLYSYCLRDDVLDKQYDEDEQELKDQYVKEMQIWKQETSYISNVDPTLDENFANGAFEITQGRMIRQDDGTVAIISEKLAEMNNLKIGDKITAEYREQLLNFGDVDKVIGNPIELEIVGIYKINFHFEPSWNTPEYDIPENYIYTSMAVGEQLDAIADDFYGENSENVFTTADFYVSDPKYLDKAMEEVKTIETINWQFFSLNKIDSSYKALLKPLETVGNFAVLLMVLSIVCGGIIVALVIAMRIRGRNKEFYIYLALGYKKSDIRKQLLFEVLIICLISFGISLLVTAVLGPLITNGIISIMSPGIPEEKYTVEYLKLGISISQAAGEFPDIDIQTDFMDQLAVFAIYTGMTLASSLLVYMKMGKKRLLEMIEG